MKKSKPAKKRDPFSGNPFGTGTPCVVCKKSEGDKLNMGACHNPKCVLIRMREMG